MKTFSMMQDQSIPYNNLSFLPPQIEKVESIAILKQESKAAVALAELKGIAKILPNQSILINAIVLKEAKASSAIENVITTHDKLYQALNTQHKLTDQATKEVLYYREALLSGFEFIKEKGFLNTNGIVKIQKQLEQNDAGIRKLSGTMLKNDLTGEIIYTPPDDFDIIMQLMKNLEDYLNTNNDEVSTLIKMAIQHYQFESIHPFYDGNGRTGRIINVLYLILHQLLDVPILYLSSYIIRNKSTYYKLLNEIRTKDNWQEWILFMLKGVEVTAKETINHINEIKELLDRTIEKVKRETPKNYSKELVELLFVHPYCKIEYVVEELKVERKTASKYLNSLVSIGILRSEMKWKETLFINTELFELLKK